MPRAFAVFGFAYCLLLAASGVRRAAAPWSNPEILQLAREGYRLVHAGRFTEAQRLLTRAAELAAMLDRPDIQFHLSATLSGLEIGLQHYERALHYAFLAREHARRSMQCEQIAMASANLSTIYLQLFDLDRAVQAAEMANQMNACMKPLSRAETFLHLGWLRSIQTRRGTPSEAGRLRQEALSFFSRGIEAADLAGSTAMVSLGLHRLGAEALGGGDLELADSALSRAFRIRRLARDPSLYMTRYYLADLKLAQGQVPLAGKLIDSVFSGSVGTRLPRYLALQLRGRIRLASGDSTQGLIDLREALSAASTWRGQIVAADSFRTNTEAGLSGIYDSFIDAALTIHERAPSAVLLAEAWEAAELNRAGSLRESLYSTSEMQRLLPGAYWDTLARLRGLEARALSENGTPALEIAAVRHSLTEMEAAAGLFFRDRLKFREKNVREISLSSFRKVLGSFRTLISFHLGLRASYRWVITAEGVTCARLPRASEINRMCTEFHDAVEARHPTAASLGANLYKVLFGGVGGDANAKWLLSLDGNLFHIPVGALVTGTEAGRPRYLVESRTTEIVPGAWAVGPGSAIPAGPFLGIGDPVYNQADPRFKAGPRLPATWKFFDQPAAELPRLVGSGREIEHCARLWSGSTTLLSGTEASRQELVAKLDSKPAAVHVATHFLPSRANSDQTMIALSLRAVAKPELEVLTSLDVSTLRVPGSLVVLSGCSSGSGKTLPGAGLISLSRAFLVAGATSVVASLWPTPDDTGEFFASFYRQLRSREPDASAASALRAAQLEMLRSSTWRSSPSYWSAYHVTARSNEVP